MTDISAGLKGSYSGNANSLFKLYFKTSLLTVLTLGIYRFWAKTRIRKYIWSSASAGGDTFEYTGTGLEKFLGFLVAVVILGVYLGLVQMVLFYFGLNIFAVEPESVEEAIAQMAAFYLTVLAIMPLWYFARYRARRYKLARTRWRGIRFGAEPAAWGYAIRALGFQLLTIVTLGLLLPLQTFKLEKFVTDRSWYGSAKFHQEGKWTELYPAMKHLFVGAAFVVLAAVIAATDSSIQFALLTMAAGYVWALVGFVYYRIKSFEYLTHNKTLGDQMRFRTAPRTGHVIKIAIFGGLAVGVVAAILFGVIGAILAAVAPGLIAGGGSIGPGIVIVAALYILALITINGLTLSWITQRILGHVIRVTGSPEASELAQIEQREADRGADAEGFADALDVGGAF